MSHLNIISEIRKQKTQNSFQVQCKSTGNSTNFSVCLIGRQQDCDIKLECKNASRYHVIIYFVENFLNIQDLDSRSRTTVFQSESGKETVLEPFIPYILNVGDVVEIENNKFQITQINLNQVVVYEPGLQVKECLFCQNKIPFFKNELAELHNDLQKLNETAIMEQVKTGQSLALCDSIIKKLQTISDIQKESEQKNVTIKSTVDVIGTNQKEKVQNHEDEVPPKKAFIPTRMHKPTPYAGKMYDDDDE